MVSCSCFRILLMTCGELSTRPPMSIAVSSRRYSVWLLGLPAAGRSDEGCTVSTIQAVGPPGLAPGRCKGKAHDADHLGYAGRRVLVSRKWSCKTLADHRADRQQWLLSTLGVSAIDPARYSRELVAPGDPDHMGHARRMLHAVADRARWQAALAEARCRATGTGDTFASGRAA
jgi:hypothetical protein